MAKKQPEISEEALEAYVPEQPAEVEDGTNES